MQKFIIFLAVCLLLLAIVLPNWSKFSIGPLNQNLGLWQYCGSDENVDSCTDLNKSMVWKDDRAKKYVIICRVLLLTACVLLLTMLYTNKIPRMITGILVCSFCVISLGLYYQGIVQKYNMEIDVCFHLIIVVGILSLFTTLLGQDDTKIVITVPSGMTPKL